MSKNHEKFYYLLRPSYGNGLKSKERHNVVLIKIITHHTTTHRKIFTYNICSWFSRLLGVPYIV